MSDDEIYEYLGQEFEWNRVKAARNAIKHRVRFTEAATVFFDPEAEYFSDPASSSEEERYTVVGWSVRMKTLLIVHLWRGDRIRIIAARRATAEERRKHEAELGR